MTSRRPPPTQRDGDGAQRRGRWRGRCTPSSRRCAPARRGQREGRERSGGRGGGGPPSSGSSPRAATSAARSRRSRLPRTSRCRLVAKSASPIDHEPALPSSGAVYERPALRPAAGPATIDAPAEGAAPPPARRCPASAHAVVSVMARYSAVHARSLDQADASAPTAEVRSPPAARGTSLWFT